MEQKDTLLISYPWWGNGHIDNRFWQAIWEKSKELHDYNPKQTLIDEAVKNGWNYKVLRHHRDGRVSVVQSNVSQ